MIIKLCDRLHNMRTGDAWPEQKRRDKALETMEVYAPIAHRLGISNVKEELEDRSLHVPGSRGLRDRSAYLLNKHGDEFLHTVCRHHLPSIWRKTASRKPPSASRVKSDLRHLPQDVHAEQAFRGDLRHLRRAHHPRHRHRVLQRPGPHPRHVSPPSPTGLKTISPPPSPTATRVAAHHRHRPRGHPLRGADPHLGDAPHRRVRHRRPLEVQGRNHRTAAAISWTSAWPGCASC